ncbi:MATE family efflux transporter DinF [Agarivorans sp. QJM3NY_25]|uniref:MATE family efflux transporter DinF n=1 Tax=Agarivorans sp. QJM3NY_25 TaxID=3421430 RepID=UPI003D7EA2D9
MRSVRLKAIAAIALPMILSNITIPLLGLVDTAVIGHLDQAHYLAGVALGSMMISLVYWLCGFLRMSTTGLVAQAVGLADMTALLKVALSSVLLAVLLGCLLVLFQQPILSLGLSLAGGGELSLHYAAEYFSTRIWGAPAALLNLVLLGCLLGLQNARAPMVLLIVGNSLNIGLDLWLVLGLDMKVQGAALATVIADYLSLALGLYLCRQSLTRLGLSMTDVAAALRGLAFDQFSRLLRLNLDIFFRSLSLQLCFAFMTFQGSRLGENIVAANAVLLNFLMFVSFALDGVAYAVEALAGKAKGAQDRAQFVGVINDCLLLAAIFALLFSLGFYLFGPSLINLLTDISEIRATANQYLAWMFVLPVAAVWCFIFDGIFIATAEGKMMRNSMLLASVGVFFPVWWLSQDWGNHALWLAMCSFMAARGLSLAYTYRLALNRHWWFKATPVG